MALVFGPIVCAPLSEYWGRRPVFLLSFLVYTAFTAGCSFAPNWPAFLFFRFMLGCAAAAPQTVSGGLFCDIYPDLGPRGMAVTLLGLTSNVGPLLGPIISGFVSPKGWQWQFWCALILAAANWPMLLLMPETFAPILNGRAARPATAQVHVHVHDHPANVGSNWCNIKRTQATLQTHVLVLVRPIRILTEPLVFFTDLFILYEYVIYFLYFGAYPIIFGKTYDMSNGVASLMWIPVGVGAIIAIAVFSAWDRYYNSSASLGKPWTLQEEYRRLPLACLGGPLFAISQFWLGWTARPSVHWVVPALSGIPYGVGIDLTFLAMNNYLTDAYDIYSASALASSVFTRNVLAAVIIPLSTYPLYQNLGIQFGCTLLGCMGLVLTPIPFVFLRWGPSLRARSPFCQELVRVRGESLPVISGASS
jgi:MFS family permease